MSKFIRLPGEPSNVIPNPDGSPVFVKGNKLAKKENMSPEAHRRRMEALMRGWAVKNKVDNGELKMEDGIDYKRRAMKRKRVRLQRTIAKSHRETQEKAREMVDAVLERLYDIVEHSPNETAVIQAGNTILDRAHGKANQTHINASIDANGKAEDISGQELDTRIEETLQRIRKLTAGEEKAAKGKARPDNVRKVDRDPDSSSVH